MSVDVPDQYKKDFQYLKEQSARGTLQASNAIYTKLEDRAKNLPGLRRALNSLNVKY